MTTHPLVRGPLRLPQMIATRNQGTIEERFTEFHEANPHIYERLVAMARSWKAHGHRRCGIKMLMEVLRFDLGTSTDTADFKLNNNYSSRYARLIAEREPDLAGMFETRKLRAR